MPVKTYRLYYLQTFKVIRFTMHNAYDSHILTILSEAGENGISVQKLAIHVYNLSCTFFNQLDKREVYRYVQQYLLHNSRFPSSIIESCPRRGYYRLNTAHSTDARQLMLQFNEQCEENKDFHTPTYDLSLNLF